MTWRVAGTQRPSRASTARRGRTFVVRRPRRSVVVRGPKTRARERSMEELLRRPGEKSRVGVGTAMSRPETWGCAGPRGRPGRGRLSRGGMTLPPHSDGRVAASVLVFRKDLPSRASGRPVPRRPPDLRINKPALDPSAPAPISPRRLSRRSRPSTSGRPPYVGLATLKNRFAWATVLCRGPREEADLDPAVLRLALPVVWRIPPV